MTLDYQKVWTTMNELEMVTSKICSAREILDSAMNALENHKLEKTETLMYAVDEYLQYYLEEFDRKFKDAWNETVSKQKELDPCMHTSGNSDIEYLSTLTSELRYTDEEMNVMCDKTEQDQITLCDTNNLSQECKESWIDFWDNSISNVYPYETEYVSSSYATDTITFNLPQKTDKVVKWRLPVEEVENGDTMEPEYFITFPDDLLEASNLKPGDEVEWVDQDNGSFLLRKITK